MNIKGTLGDFRAEEHIRFPGESGAYSYYRVEKYNAPIATVREGMAKKLGVSPSSVVFPAPRDIAPVGVLYASVRKKGPARFKGQGFIARRVQHGPRALRSKDLRSNRFTIMVRHLSKTEVPKLKKVIYALENAQIPNYYDDQRFASWANEGFIGKAILVGDAEKVVHFYLAEPMLGDSDKIREFKLLVKSHWGQWGYLLHQAPRPSNFRSVISYLKNNPHDYAEAANHIRDRRLSFYLLAYQSWIWNHILAQYLKQRTTISAEVEIAGTRFPLPSEDEWLLSLQDLSIELPRLTANYQGEIAAAAEAALESEGLTLGDFNVRLVRRVCLTKAERAAWFAPTDVALGEPVADEDESEHWAVPVNFTLTPGHYATLVMKVAAARIGTIINVT